MMTIIYIQKMNLLKKIYSNFLAYCVMILWCIMAPIWKHNFKSDMKIPRLKFKPLQNYMTNHHTLREFIYQCIFLCANIWYKCNISLTTNTCESDTANINFAIYHNYFTPNFFT